MRPVGPSTSSLRHVRGRTAELTGKSGLPPGVPSYGGILDAARTPRAPTKVCSVFGCQNTEAEPEKVFHPFPACQQLRAKWIELINRSDLKNSTKIRYSQVCSDHFDDSDMEEGRLKPDAVPHLGLPRKRVPIIYAPDPQASGFLPTTNHQIMPTSLAVKEEPPESDTMEVEIQMESANHLTDRSNLPAGQLLVNTTPFNHPPSIPPTVKPIPQNFQNNYGIRTLVIDPLIPTPQENTAFKIIKVERVDSTTEVNPTLDEKANKKRKFHETATISAVEQIDIAPTINIIKKASLHVQTTKNLIDKMNEPMIKKFKAQIREAKSKIKKLENPRWNRDIFLASCDHHLDPKISEAVKSHLSFQARFSTQTSNRYSKNFKTFALDLYLSSPQSYKFLEQFFYMPSLKTLRRFQIPIKTGNNQHLMDKFKPRVDDMNEREKICAVCFGDVVLKKNLYYDITNDFLCGIQDIEQVLGSEPAQFATLLMVRGLYSKWTQPISFAFVAQKTCNPALQVWILNIIALLIDIGLNVKAFVADMDNEFFDFSIVTPTQPYFMVGDKKIYHIFDVPCLYRSARDDLLQYNFHFGSEVSKLDHILKVHEIDKEEELSLMPKITEDHIRPQGEEKEKVKLAVDVFSEKVAAVINFHVKTNLVPKKFKETAKFIAKMSRLYDLLTSQKTTCQNELKEAYKATKEQEKVLFETLEYLETLEMKDKKGYPVEKQMTFVTGLSVTIRALTGLSEDLKAEGIPYIFTKKLSKDCVDSYFAKARQKGGNNIAQLTAIRFIRSFHRLFLSSLVTYAKEGKSEVDLMSSLTKISTFAKSDATDDESEQNMVKLPVKFTEYQKLWPVPSLAFRTGYILRKCLESQPCCQEMVETLCEHYKLEIPAEDNRLNALVEKCKEYNVDNMKKKVTAPPEYLVDLVDKMEEMYNDYYRSSDVQSYDFGSNFYKIIEDMVVVEGKPCLCFPFRYFKFLFIRMRIFQTVKEYNVSVDPIRRRRRRR